MPQQNQSSDLATNWLGFTEDRRSALLQKMSPEQKATLRSAIESHSGAPSAILQERVKRLSLQNQTPLPKPPAQPPSFLSAPMGFMGNQIKGAEQATQSLKNKAYGPESERRGFLAKRGFDIASLAPETAGVLYKVGAGLLDWKTAAALLAGKVHPAIAASYFAATGAEQTMGEAQSGKVFTQWPNPDNVQNFLLGLSQTAGATAGAEGGRVPTIGEMKSHLEGLRERARKAGQEIAGAGSEKTTLPLAEKYKAGVHDAATKQVDENVKAAQKQAAENEKIGTANRAAEVARQKEIDKAFVKGGESATARTKAVAEQNAEYGKALEEHHKTVQEQARRESLERGIEEGGRRVGEQIQDLDAKLREEGNEKYATVREATAQDPGVPLVELSKEASHAEKNILKGSQENIKQFRELIRKAPDAAGVQTSAGFAAPGDPLYEQLASEGALDTGGNLTFDQLQGYSTELGMKLAGGNLPGDVYQAMKYLKGKIDAQKAVIADRNGVGGALRSADGFWREYMSAFYDKPSAVAAVRENVQTLDPQHWATPIIEGKASEKGISALKNLKTRYATEARSVADLALNLRKSNSELSAIKPKAVTAPSRPAPVPPAKPVTVDLAPLRPEPPVQIKPKVVEKPKPPTAQELREAKAEKIHSKSGELSGLRRYDLMVIAGSVIAPFVTPSISHLTSAAAGVGAVAAEKGLAMGLNRPKVVEWLSQPRPEELQVLNELPENAKMDVRLRMQQFVDEQKAKGKPLKVAPSVEKFLLMVTKKTPGQMKKEISEIRDRYRTEPSSNPFVR